MAQQKKRQRYIALRFTEEEYQQVMEYVNELNIPYPAVVCRKLVLSGIRPIKTADFTNK